MAADLWDEADKQAKAAMKKAGWMLTERRGMHFADRGGVWFHAPNIRELYALCEAHDAKGVKK